ncbi:FG-GAP-like repeat-containing protein [Candidatus Halobeggiatoa sp. HSG11]|nr:FG-GAP-like repeat-containing protein [Candidatus Halobeggiatoa sp. HSG11]
MKQLLTIILLVSITPALQATAKFSSENVVTTSADGAYSVYAIDVNGDSYIDILSASYSDNKIAWYENDGSQNFTTHVITTSVNNARDVYAIDMDGDNDIDILSASKGDSEIAWHENDGSQNFTTHVVTTSANNARSVHAMDMDGDTDIDIVSASQNDNKIAWYENDGSQNFTTHVVSTSARNAYSVYAIDMDGDSDVDILSASWDDNKIAWYENDGSQNFTTHNVSTSADSARTVHAIDVDGDSDIDILSASDNTINWYENDGSQNFTTHVVTNPANGAFSVYAMDMDGDTDIDIVSASASDDKIAWYENDGSQNFTTHIVATSADGARSVYAIDVDGDSDIVSASLDDDKIAWYENLPIIINISAIDGTYEIGDTVDITIQFSNIVNVTGTPQLTLETGTTDAVVNYSSGSGTDSLTFTYTVVSGNISTDLDYASTTALSGGTIQSSSANDADLTLPTPGATNSLGSNSSIIIGISVPNAPLNLTATTVSQSRINLSWIDNSSNETGFKIKRGNTLIATTTGSSYSSNSLTCGKNYNYSVEATNSNGDSVAVTASATTSACPVTVYYMLTIEKTGNGTITTSYGIDCGTDCDHNYADQTELTLTATPDTDWVFNGWDGDCDENGEVRMHKDKTCTANFVQEHTLTINIEGEGTVDDCGASCTKTYLDGEEIALTTTTEGIWSLDNWSGDCDEEGNVTMNSDKTCTATFIEGYSLNIVINNNRGSVKTVTQECEEDCEEIIEANSTTTLVAESEMEWVLDSFSGDCDSEGNVAITGEKICTANFMEDPYIPNNGDGNDDGLLDAHQPNIVSIPDQSTDNYLTIAVSGNATVKEIYTDLAENQGYFDEKYIFPQGLVYFELEGTEADITIYYHSLKELRATPHFQKYGNKTPGDMNTLGWYILPDVEFDIVEVGGQPVVTANYHLTDGGLGDSTGIDGRIIDPGGLTFDGDFNKLTGTKQ